MKISNLQEDVKHKAIFNLFSIYGVILKISINTETKEAFVIYDEKESINEAIKNLKNLKFFN